MTKNPNFWWIISVLAVIIIALASFILTKRVIGHESIENYISVCSTILSITLSIFAILYTYESNIDTRQHFDKINSSAERIKDLSDKLSGTNNKLNENLDQILEKLNKVDASQDNIANLLNKDITKNPDFEKLTSQYSNDVSTSTKSQQQNNYKKYL